VKVIDSSVWLELVTDGPLAARCAQHLTDLAEVVTPTVVLLEVYRVLRRQGREPAALRTVGEMEYTRLVAVDAHVAITAADLSIDHGLAAADALIYATARLEGCELVTADSDFRGLPGVVLVEAEGDA
jgi:predicted nucleic acid-binding protein